LYTTDEDDEEVEEEEEDKFYSADEGYDTFHPEDGEGEGEGTGSDSDPNSRLNALRPKVPHHLPSLLSCYLSIFLITYSPSFLVFAFFIS
jgi:hypothetical protein